MRNWDLGIGVFALLAVAALTQSPTWTWAGPKQLSRGTSSSQLMLGGPLDAVVASTSASGTPLILAAGDGGIWTLQGGVWTPTSEGAPITALAVGTQGQVYASTPTGLIASSDGGQTWTTLAAAGLSGLPIRSLVSAGSQLFALTSSGLFGSSDSGATWTLALAGNYASMAQQGSTILLVGAAPVELPIPLDATPQPVAGLPTSWAFAAAAAVPSGGFDLVLTNADGSSSLWTVSAAGAATLVSSLPALPGEPALALAVDPNSLLWLADAQGLWAWQPTAGLTDENSGLANIAPLGLVLSTSGVMATLDDGQFASGTATAWNESSEGASKLTALVQSGGVLTAIGGGALWQSSNAGASWSPLATTYSGGAVPTALAASAGLWIGTSSGSLVAPDATSHQVCTAPATALAVQGTYIWAACGAAIYRSVDAGASWQLAATLPSAVVALAAEAAWPGLVIAADAGGGLQWSEDYGSTWSSAVNLPNGGAPITALAFDTSETLWVATLGRGLWTASFVPPPAEVISVAAPASAAAGTAVSVQVTVEAGSTPDSGVTVQFAASENNRSIWTTTATTGSNGVAQASFTPTQAGAVAILVSDAANSQYQAQAALSVTPAPAAKLVLFSGAGQSEVAGDLLTSPIVIEADDAYGNPVPAVSVAFTGGQFNPASGKTGSNGQISTQFTLPLQPGTVTLTATSSGLPSLTWTETALAPPDFSIAISTPASPVPPGQLASLTVAITGQGGFTQPVSLLCEQPATACSISPATVSPGGNATITISPPANQASLPVEVVGSSAALGRQHTAAATLSLEAFSFAAPGGSLSVTAGSTSAPIPLSLTPENGLSGPVVFSVLQADGSPLPASLSPQFQPSSVALAASGGPAQVQFAVAAASAASRLLLPPRGRRLPPWAPFALSLALLAVFATCLPRRRRTLAGLALALTMVGCGGAPAAAPPPKPVAPPPRVVTYNLEVTATVDKLTASIPIILTLTTP